MRKLWKFSALLFCVPLLLGTSSCPDNHPKDTVQTEQSRKAQEAANSLQFTDNAEIDNIKARLQLTANPGLLGFIMLLNEMGQPIIYEGVKGKVTSGGKRLSKPYHVLQSGNGNGGVNMLSVPAPSDEGTQGTSGEYIFYTTVNGEYRQWNGKYFYSDKPFRLRVEPLVITTK